MDADPAQLLAEIVRIVDGRGDDEGVVIPSDMDPKEAVRRLERVPDGAGWPAIHAALNASPSA